MQMYQGVSQGLVLGPVSVSVCRGAKNDEIENMLITFSDELRVDVTASTLEVGTRIRRN